ncbi:MAG: hypothetical protein MZW92_23490 [Comamonadaceae bacterium]|nr:hypothetical protein [Comamonadaceae bacterium]
MAEADIEGHVQACLTKPLRRYRCRRRAPTARMLPPLRRRHRCRRSAARLHERASRRRPCVAGACCWPRTTRSTSWSRRPMLQALGCRRRGRARNGAGGARAL